MQATVNLPKANLQQRIYDDVLAMIKTMPMICLRYEIFLFDDAFDLICSDHFVNRRFHRRLFASYACLLLFHRRKIKTNSYRRHLKSSCLMMLLKSSISVPKAKAQYEIFLPSAHQIIPKANHKQEHFIVFGIRRLLKHSMV